MSGFRLKEHHVVQLILIALLLLVLIGVRAVGGQVRPLTSAAVRAAADTGTQLRVIVSISQRRLWILGASGDTLRAAPVAVGSGKRLTLGNRAWRFATPVGIRTVLSAETDPLWIRPDWAYLEMARERKLRLDSVSARHPRVLRGGDSLVARGAEVGVVHEGRFTAWAFDKDIVIDRVLYMPPLGSPYRASAGVLGRHRLNLGDGIGFHGTNDPASVGKAVTHGCMRLRDDDVEWMFLNVPVGTPVFIY